MEIAVRPTAVGNLPLTRRDRPGPRRQPGPRVLCRGEEDDRRSHQSGAEIYLLPMRPSGRAIAMQSLENLLEETPEEEHWARLKLRELLRRGEAGRSPGKLRQLLCLFGYLDEKELRF